MLKLQTVKGFLKRSSNPPYALVDEVEATIFTQLQYQEEKEEINEYITFKNEAIQRYNEEGLEEEPLLELKVVTL